MQRWRFLVIRDKRIKQTVGALYKRAWDEQVAPRYRAGDPAPGMSRERFLRLLDAAEYLAAHIHEPPVWIVPLPRRGTPTRSSGSSIYPAVQNMLLAARALGLGATLTTLYMACSGQSPCGSGRCRLGRSVGPALPRSVAETGWAEVDGARIRSLSLGWARQSLGRRRIATGRMGSIRRIRMPH
jgi:hypothetical protein